MAMHMGGTGGEWADLTIRPVSADGTSERGARRPPPRPAHEGEADVATPDEPAPVPPSDRVTLGPREASAPPADRASLMRVALLPVQPLGVDLQSGWAALVEASTLQPAFRFWKPRRRDRIWRGGRSVARALPLGVPLTPCEAILGAQVPEQPAPCCPPPPTADPAPPPAS